MKRVQGSIIEACESRREREERVCGIHTLNGANSREAVGVRSVVDWISRRCLFGEGSSTISSILIRTVAGSSCPVVTSLLLGEWLPGYLRGVASNFFAFCICGLEMFLLTARQNNKTLSDGASELI